MTPEPYYQSLKDFVAMVSKLTEGKTPEEIEAWKAEIDRGRHPQDYVDVSPVSCDKRYIAGECDELTDIRGHDTVTPDAKPL
jgi:hypothetical protein